MHTLGFLNLGPMELGLILLIGLVFFGRRLPEIGRNVGKTIVEFKKGLADAGASATEATVPPPAANTNQQLTASSGPVKTLKATSDEP